MKWTLLAPALLWACSPKPSSDDDDGTGLDSSPDSAVDSSQDSAAPESLWCPEPFDAPGFDEVGEAMGLVDTDDLDKFFQEQNPVAMADLDGDGLDDLILAVRETGIWVQMNRGDYLDSELLDPQKNVSGLAIGDVDGNGTLDLWAGGRFNGMKLFLGDGAGGFEDVSKKAGFQGIPTNPDKMDAVFGDFDNDGDLDLFVNQATMPQRASEKTMDKLFRNKGNGQFEHVSHWLEDSERLGMGWSSVWTDIDLDGDLDLYTANADQVFNGPSRLLRNDGPGPDNDWIFTDLSESCLCTENNNPMGVSSGDWNNDGLFDFFTTNTGSNTMLQNAGNYTYIQMSAQTTGMVLPTEKHMTFGSVWIDYDNDGWQDLYMTSGPLGSDDGRMDLAHQADIFLKNNQGKELIDIAPELGLDAGDVGRGVTMGMLNDDGYPDIASLNLGNPSFLYQARCTTNRALVIDLEGKPPNTFGVGSRIVVETTQGKQHREVTTKPGWGGSMHPRVYFGLGKSRVKSVTVHWLGGDTQIVEVDPGVDGRIRVAQEE